MFAQETFMSTFNMKSIVNIEKEIASEGSSTQQTETSEMNLPLNRLNDCDSLIPSILEYHNTIVENCLHEYNKIVIDESQIVSRIEIVLGTSNETSRSNYIQNVVENKLYNHTSSNNSDYLVPVADIMLYDEIYQIEEKGRVQRENVEISSERKDIEKSKNYIKPILPIRNRT